MKHKGRFPCKQKEANAKLPFGRGAGLLVAEQLCSDWYSAFELA